MQEQTAVIEEELSRLHEISGDTEPSGAAVARKEELESGGEENEDNKPRLSLVAFVEAEYRDGADDQAGVRGNVATADVDPLRLSRTESDSCGGLSFICALCGLIQASPTEQQSHMEICRKRQTKRNPGVKIKTISRREVVSLTQVCGARKTSSIRKKGGHVTCKMCGKVLCSARTLRAHMYVHKGETPYVDPLYGCDKCDARFPHYSSLKKHKVIHSGERPFACEKCSFRSTQRSCLVEHTRIHTGERPYSCDVCGASFTQKNTLVKHKYTHTGERPHACDLCDARFTQKNTLTKHRRTHTGERPYACGDCDARFTQGSSLAKHRRMHVESPYACADCRARFPTVESLAEHALVHLQERKHDCKECGRKFECRSKLVRHVVIHCYKSDNSMEGEVDCEEKEYSNL